MIKSPEFDVATDRHHPPVTLLLLTIVDTTWRMFVPILGLTLIGIQMDLSLKKTPMCTMVMMIVGAICSLLLIKLQLIKVKNND
jgi:hypothetical protein